MNTVTGKSVHAAIWSKFHTQLRDSTGGFCLFMDHPVVFGVYYKLWQTSYSFIEFHLILIQYRYINIIQYYNAILYYIIYFTFHICNILQYNFIYIHSCFATTCWCDQGYRATHLPLTCPVGGKRPSVNHEPWTNIMSMFLHVFASSLSLCCRLMR